MSITVAIPAEIVGDTETLRQRRADIESESFLWANALGKAVRDEVGSVDYAAAHIARITQPWNAIMAELHRRHLAVNLAHPEWRWLR